LHILRVDHRRLVPNQGRLTAKIKLALALKALQSEENSASPDLYQRANEVKLGREAGRFFCNPCAVSVS
jgi:hypothetical protein